VTLPSCNYANKWKNSQIAESHAIAQGSKIAPPATPPAEAKDLAEDLPVDAAWQVYDYSEAGDTTSAKLISSVGAEQTTEYIDSRLHSMGYDSGDNLSRILEGVTYSGRGKYSSIYVKVDMNTADQVTVELRATK
jgi:hypothetical protein